MHLTARRKRGLRREANGFRTPIMALLPKLALRGLLAAPAGPLVGLITPLAGLRTAAKGLTAGMSVVMLAGPCRSWGNVDGLTAGHVGQRSLKPSARTCAGGRLRGVVLVVGGLAVAVASKRP